jgi:calcineurin-like phosphoesterase family protein
MIWFTADTHFGHANIIKYCNRPFPNVEVMNNTIKDNWNRVVRPQDTIYILGDVAMKISYYEIRKILSTLNGQKYVILGDHDKQIWKCTDLIEEITPLKKITIDNISITLCHYCMRVWWKSHFNSWHLFGHSHGYLDAIGKSHDVGVDNNNFTPISFDELKIIMNNKPNNFNYIGYER